MQSEERSDGQDIGCDQEKIRTARSRNRRVQRDLAIWEREKSFGNGTTSKKKVSQQGWGWTLKSLKR